jgi:hypothetical protein
MLSETWNFVLTLARTDPESLTVTGDKSLRRRLERSGPRSGFYADRVSICRSREWRDFFTTDEWRSKYLNASSNCSVSIGQWLMRVRIWMRRRGIYDLRFGLRLKRTYFLTAPPVHKFTTSPFNSNNLVIQITNSAYILKSKQHYILWTFFDVECNRKVSGSNPDWNPASDDIGF